MKLNKQNNKKSGRKDSGMKANKWSKLGQMVAVVAGFSLAASMAWAGNQTENLPFTQKTGSVDGCPGAYYGIVKMTNGTGSVWITPPANTTQGTLTDISGFGTNYVSAAYAVQLSTMNSWCGTNTVTFPATSSDQYCLAIYVKSSPPPPTNGEPVVVQITWQ